MCMLDEMFTLGMLEHSNEQIGVVKELSNSKGIVPAPHRAW